MVAQMTGQEEEASDDDDQTKTASISVTPAKKDENDETSIKHHLPYYHVGD
jgi:hypothetical protein